MAREALTREQAVIAYTLAAAYSEFAEKDNSSPEPRKFADLAVPSLDIFIVCLTKISCVHKMNGLRSR